MYPNKTPIAQQNLRTKGCRWHNTKMEMTHFFQSYGSLLIHTCNHLFRRDVVSSSLVCKEWNDIFGSNLVWEKVFHLRWKVWIRIDKLDNRMHQWLSILFDTVDMDKVVRLMYAHYAIVCHVFNREYDQHLLTRWTPRIDQVFIEKWMLSAKIVEHYAGKKFKEFSKVLTWMCKVSDMQHHLETHIAIVGQPTPQCIARLNDTNYTIKPDWLLQLERSCVISGYSKDYLAMTKQTRFSLFTTGTYTLVIDFEKRIVGDMYVNNVKWTVTNGKQVFKEAVYENTTRLFFLVSSFFLSALFSLFSCQLFFLVTVLVPPI